MRSDYHPKGAPFTGGKMLVTIVAFFAVIIAVNALMAWFAVHNFRGVVVDSGFVASQDFNADAARLTAQRERGWRIVAELAGDRPAVRLAGPDGAPLAGLVVVARALRPENARLDVPLTLVEAAPGLYAAAETLAPGRWRVAFIADGAGPRYAGTLDLRVEP